MSIFNSGTTTQRFFWLLGFLWANTAWSFPSSDIHQSIGSPLFKQKMTVDLTQYLNQQWLEVDSLYTFLESGSDNVSILTSTTMPAILTCTGGGVAGALCCFGGSGTTETSAHHHAGSPQRNPPGGAIGNDDDDDDDEDGGKKQFTDYKKKITNEDPLAGTKREWVALLLKHFMAKTLQQKQAAISRMSEALAQATPDDSLSKWALDLLKPPPKKNTGTEADAGYQSEATLGDTQQQIWATILRLSLINFSCLNLRNLGPWPDRIINEIASMNKKTRKALFLALQPKKTRCF